MGIRGWPITVCCLRKVSHSREVNNDNVPSTAEVDKESRGLHEKARGDGISLIPVHNFDTNPAISPLDTKPANGMHVYITRSSFVLTKRPTRELETVERYFRTDIVNMSQDSVITGSRVPSR